MSGSAFDIFFRESADISIRMTKQVIKTRGRLSMQLLRRSSGIHETIIQRSINLRVKLLQC